MALVRDSPDRGTLVAPSMSDTPNSFVVHTLGCPKNQVDSDKLAGLLVADGLSPARDAAEADMVVVNTCAFVEEARQESVEVILALAEAKAPGASLVVTGCLAERYGDELAEALPEADLIAGFGMALTSGSSAPTQPGGCAGGVGPSLRPSDSGVRPSQPPPTCIAPPVGVREDRRGGATALAASAPFPASAAPSAAGRSSRSSQRWSSSTRPRSCSWPRISPPTAGTRARASASSCRWWRRVAARADRTRLLYLYPSDLNDALIDAICATGVPYFDLSLQHVSPPLLRRMRRWGDGERFLARIEAIRRREPEAAFRSNFIVGYPGETEEDHDLLLRFVEEAQLDWCGFFAYSEESGTYSSTLEGKVDEGLRSERLAELGELQDAITARRRDLLIGRRVEVLVDEPGVGRTHREAPEIDGVVHVPASLAAGTFAQVTVSAAAGCDLEAA